MVTAPSPALQTRQFSQSSACSNCGTAFPELQPRLFSFNNPFGACSECTGLGVKMEFDPDLELEPGLIIEFATEDGETLPGTILQHNEDEVRVDLNHPLAGKTVRYSVKIVAVDDPPEESKTLH